MKRYIISIMIISLLGVAHAGIPYTQRRQIKPLPENLLIPLSLSEYSALLATHAIVPVDHPSAMLVDKVGERMIAAVEEFAITQKFFRKLKNFVWEYQLVLNTDANAYCLPGGKMLFCSGIFPIVKDEEGVAFLMGHEIAHAIANHGSEKMSQQLMLTMGSTSLDDALIKRNEETRAVFRSVYGIGGAKEILAYSPQQEIEADKLGMVIMAMAGYNPEKALAFWNEMACFQGNARPSYLSLHPAGSERVDNIRSFLPEAMKYFQSLSGTSSANPPKKKPIQIK